MKFCDMKYERPDIEKIKTEWNGYIEATAADSSGESVLETILRADKSKQIIESMITLAQIRHSLDVNDKYYDEENDYCRSVDPEISGLYHKLLTNISKSKHRSFLESRLPELYFKNADMFLRTYSDSIKELLKEENELITAYEKLMANARIPFDDKILNISQLAVYKQNPDRNIRKSAYIAEGTFFNDNKEELDSIFDRMVKCRTGIAKGLGFDSFTELAYFRLCRNCYNADDVNIFRNEVIDSLVPVCVDIKDKQREKINVDKLRFYDDLFLNPEGNPKPVSDYDGTLQSGKTMFEQMSGETKEFINFMLDNSLLDLVARPGKEVGGYCTDIPLYKSPFIFSNFNGTADDVEVLTHEAGHAFASYEAGKNDSIPLSDLHSPTMESCETHSMSMEFLAWPWYDLYYGELSNKAKEIHLKNCITFIPYGTMVDHFQHIIYDNPDLSPEQRDEKWLELEKKYRPYIDFEDIPFYSKGAGWQRQIHIYECPFYYIDYCLAQTNALNIWSLSLKDYEGAFDNYMRFVDKAGLLDFKSLCKESGLKSPFEKGCLKQAADNALKWINDNV